MEVFLWVLGLQFYISVYYRFFGFGRFRVVVLEFISCGCCFLEGEYSYGNSNRVCWVCSVNIVVKVEQKVQVLFILFVRDSGGYSVGCFLGFFRQGWYILL